jgi:hypothetical protein
VVIYFANLELREMNLRDLTTRMESVACAARSLLLTTDVGGPPDLSPFPDVVPLGFH